MKKIFKPYLVYGASTVAWLGNFIWSISENSLDLRAGEGTLRVVLKAKLLLAGKRVFFFFFFSLNFFLRFLFRFSSQWCRGKWTWFGKFSFKRQLVERPKNVRGSEIALCEYSSLFALANEILSWKAVPGREGGREGEGLGWKGGRE